MMYSSMSPGDTVASAISRNSQPILIVALRRLFSTHHDGATMPSTATVEAVLNLVDAPNLLR